VFIERSPREYKPEDNGLFCNRDLKHLKINKEKSVNNKGGEMAEESRGREIESKKVENKARKMDVERGFVVI